MPFSPTLLARPYQQAHQPGEWSPREASEQPGEDLFQRFPTTSHLVWGRVVPGIPDFCRELVAALGEE